MKELHMTNTNYQPAPQVPVGHQMQAMPLNGEFVVPSLVHPGHELQQALLHGRQGVSNGKGAEKDDTSEMAQEVIEHEILGHILGPIWAMIKAQSDIQSESKPIRSAGKAAKIDPKLSGDMGSSLMVAPAFQATGVRRRPLLDLSGMDEMRNLRPR